MGITSKLFYNPEDRENSLSYRIRPSDEQFASQQERWNALAEVLKEKLREDTGKPVSSWLQGSYKFGTQIRPARMDEEFDIDLGVYVEWQGASDEGVIGPKELKDRVQSILEAYASESSNDASEVAQPKARCNRVRFAEDFHIDVPSYHLDRKADYRSLATENDEWEESDPKSLYVWWKEQFEDRERDRARRLTRYLKMWAALSFENGSRPSSILLTVLMVESLKKVNGESLSGDDEYFHAVITGIVDRLKKSAVVQNPKNTNENLNRLSDDEISVFKDRLVGLKSIAQRGLEASDEYEGADIWSEAFKHFFPVPREDPILEKSSLRNALAQIMFTPDVLVIATSGKHRWEGFNSIAVIPRGCEIDFVITNPETLPDGAIVSWTVRNEGSEAESVNDLGHVAGEGLRNRESSAYQGTHYMDVVVKLYGRIIGRRRVKVVVSGLGVPLRNRERPSWVRLR